MWETVNIKLQSMTDQKIHVYYIYILKFHSSDVPVLELIVPGMYNSS